MKVLRRFLLPFLLLAACGGERTGLSQTILPADGLATVSLTLPLDAAGRRPRVTNAPGLLRAAGSEPCPAGVRFFFQAGYAPGEERITVRYPDRIEAHAVRLYARAEDGDGDGFPDAAELRDELDRRRFRNWFCLVAEAQYAWMWPRWERAQRDCAGLIRFAYAEALKRHDGRWYRRSGRLPAPGGPDVRAFSYPLVPWLGERLFRIRPAAAKFSTNDFSTFASAGYLLSYNTRFVSRDPGEALPGDLLFYRQRDETSPRSEDAMHAMIFLERGKLVYHTGDPERGEVRRLALDTLAQHPDWRWHPVPANPNYLGVYRFLILEDRTP